MKCVGIITIQSIVNYGNRLQNYAVEQILEQRGYTVESIRIAEPMLWFKIYTKAFLSKFFCLNLAEMPEQRQENF